MKRVKLTLTYQELNFLDNVLDNLAKATEHLKEAEDAKDAAMAYAVLDTINGLQEKIKRKKDKNNVR